MAAPASKTMFNYFSKLPSKAIVVEESNPRKLAPKFNKQHVEQFQNRLEQFDAELFSVNNNQSFFHEHDGCGDNSVEILDGSNKINQLENGDVPMDISISSTNYITSIKSRQHKPFKLVRKLRGPLRAKLLQYHEDVRPPYYGTWQRKSKKISGRRPFTMDDDIFDYDADSEAEWDIGGPGESLKGDDSEDEEEIDDYEIDMKTFVPHGYVSDDEVEVHSDQDEAPSADQSMEEICDVQDDSNISVQIVAEKGTRPQPKLEQVQQQAQQRQTIQNRSPVQQVPQQPIKQAKLEIKPITLGIYYENEQPITLSESKIQFMKTFQGVSCK